MDILIATPGRLVDHIQGTINFTVQHLAFLVIDEADRLLNQNFHEWLKQIQSAYYDQQVSFNDVLNEKDQFGCDYSNI